MPELLTDTELCEMIGTTEARVAPVVLDMLRDFQVGGWRNDQLLQVFAQENVQQAALYHLMTLTNYNPTLQKNGIFHISPEEVETAMFNLIKGMQFGLEQHPNTPEEVLKDKIVFTYPKTNNKLTLLDHINNRKYETPTPFMYRNFHGFDGKLPEGTNLRDFMMTPQGTLQNKHETRFLPEALNVRPFYIDRLEIDAARLLQEMTKTRYNSQFSSMHQTKPSGYGKLLTCIGTEEIIHAIDSRTAAGEFEYNPQLHNLSTEEYYAQDFMEQRARPFVHQAEQKIDVIPPFRVQNEQDMKNWLRRAWMETAIEKKANQILYPTTMFQHYFSEVPAIGKEGAERISKEAHQQVKQELGKIKEAAQDAFVAIVRGTLQGQCTKTLRENVQEQVLATVCDQYIAEILTHKMCKRAEDAIKKMSKCQKNRIANDTPSPKLSWFRTVIPRTLENGRQKAGASISI